MVVIAVLVGIVGYTTHGGETGELRERVKELETRVKMQRDSMETLRSTVRAYRDSMETLRNRIKELETRVKMQRDSMETLRSTVRAYRDSMETLRNRIKELETRVKMQRDSIETLRSTVRAYRDSMETLRNRIKELEGKIDEESGGGGVGKPSCLELLGENQPNSLMTIRIQPGGFYSIRHNSRANYILGDFSALKEYMGAISDRRFRLNEMKAHAKKISELNQEKCTFFVHLENGGVSLDELGLGWLRINRYFGGLTNPSVLHQ